MALVLILSSTSLLGLACASDQGSPFSAVVIAFDAKNQTYRLAQVRVATLSSLKRLEGTSGTMRGGGAVQVDATLIPDASATVDSLSASFFTAEASPVSLNYSVLNELVYPEDYLSLELLTAYVNVERARAAFTSWGVTGLAPGRLYAHTALEDERGLTPLKSGELYYPPMGAFFFPLASEKAQQLPVHFNLGAMTHAVALQVFQEKAWGGRPQDPAAYAPETDPDRVAARHVWQAISMGLADFLGGAAGEDPRWFEKSIAQEAAARNLDQQLRCGDAAMLQALETEDRPGVPPFDPYPLGTVLGAALWTEACPDGICSGLKAAATDTAGSIAALGDIAAQNGGKVSITTALDTLVNSAVEERKSALCWLFLDRFASMSVSSLPACAGVTPTQPTWAETCQ